jgi:hypothetical protein
MKILETPIDLSGGGDLVGKLLPLSGLEQSPTVLADRNFAVLKLSDRSGEEWDSHGNLWVEFYREEREAAVEQALLGANPSRSGPQNG